MSELLTPTEIDYWANAIRLGADLAGSRVSDLVRLLEERANARLRERIAKLEECVKAADAMRKKVTTLSTYDDKERVQLGARYNAARAALGEVEREG